ncbi:MAG: hypothetical protein L3J93_01035 [Thermoplasmata archaeon]|nr:hypothetical protein [Thermoplasmata archaeon]
MAAQGPPGSESGVPPLAKAPRGLFWAGLVEALLGFFSLIGGVVHIFLGVGGLVTASGQDVNLGAIANVLGDVLTVAGLALVAGGIGLILRARWSWILSISVLMVGVVVSVVALVIGSVAAVPSLLVAIVLLVYLSFADVRTYLHPVES